jgi:YebC/PmpR family DNA-binding regulatory protein
MSGHSKWKQIKHKKEITDKKRSKTFSKLLKAIRVAAKSNPNPEFNPRLRSAIDKAKESQVPQNNIERAVEQSGEKDLEEVTVEAYGPNGSALIIEAVTDNTNRTINEIKNTLKNMGAKFAEPGSVRWSFELNSGGTGWIPKFKQELNETDSEKLNQLIEAIEEHDDVQEIFTNV